MLLSVIIAFSPACKKPYREVRKPVVYIYPDKKQEVSVQLHFNGTLRATYPLYNTSWNFMADVDGSLTDTKTGEQYQYLFYDGVADINYPAFTEGFTVKTDTVIDFLKHKLIYLGLNEKERNDMISFWLPELNEKEFVQIRFRLNDDCNEIAKLSITPKPETEIRVMIEFRSTDAYKALPAQKLSRHQRKGFTVVEWGGVNLGEEGEV